MLHPRFVALAALGALAFPVGSLAAQAPAAPPRVAASSFASVEVHLNARWIGGKWYEEDAGLTGPARIAITYGQPHARGRKVEGGLVPLDTVWRFGANQATTLHTDVDMRLGDLEVPRGDYTLFILYTRAGWQLIVSRGTGQWGTDYDPRRDLGRVALVSRALPQAEESLSVYLIPDAPSPATGFAQLSGVLRVRWGSSELSTSWRVAP
ncbi:MAG TPA: DUF2911 domain-containing protein [Gemmatimonadales bacterium]|jgi:hypothetical protein|nr:DUF2911 domain-containing protein [Gemmatimonadales bacterium]